MDKKTLHYKKVIDTYLVTKYHTYNEIGDNSVREYTKRLNENKYGCWAELETDKVSEEEFKSNYGNRASKVSSEKVTIVVEEYPNKISCKVYRTERIRRVGSPYFRIRKDLTYITYNFKYNNFYSGTISKKNKSMIKNFLVISCTGNNDMIALKTNNKFFLKKLQTNIIKYEALTLVILDFIKEHNVEIEQNFSILVNSGPGSFSGIRIALAITKGIQLVKKLNIYSYNNFVLNAAPYLKKTKSLISIIKTNNFYYFSEGIIDKTYNFSAPKKLDLGYLKTSNLQVIIPDEIKKDEIIYNTDKKKLCIVEFDLKNVDILIENNLLENKLIKPLYLS